MNIINSLITDFSTEKLILFFQQNINTFKQEKDSYEYLFEEDEDIFDNYINIEKLGEADINNSDDLLIIASKTIAPLTERTSKKRQFDIAKKILKEENKDAAFFIFYDQKGNFRFSFIRANFLGTKRDFTNFKRYTYFINSELTNKTFISQISEANFNELDSIQEAFSVEPLNKDFYQQLANWFFWLLENIKFPKDAKKDINGQYYQASIRLVTRLIFVWFIKEKGFIKKDLFDENEIKNLLNNSSDNENDYYLAILQNLFFATLNTPIKDRVYIKNKKSYNSDHGDHSKFRHQKLVKDKEKWLNLFKNIPFLNGGIFDCLDVKGKGIKEIDRKYIDGFSQRRGKKYQPQIPNFLFFARKIKKEKPYNCNLNKIFRTSKKKYELGGIINIFKDFNFTVEENTPLDQEVALDPILLGSVFENLLASFNEETEEQARKKTGSFYTPPEVVDYMVSESLKNFLKTKLYSSTKTYNELGSPQSNLFGNKNKIQTTLQNENNNIWGKIDDFSNKLNTLFAYEQQKNPFDGEQTKKLIEKLQNIKILDPACGSGAFPMGILQKMVFVFTKLDPENEIFKAHLIKKERDKNKDIIDKIENDFENKIKISKNKFDEKIAVISKDIDSLKSLQIEKAKKQALSILSEEEDKAKNNFSNEIKKAQEEHDIKIKNIEVSFDKTKNELDYARKLYLIRDCIYGADIQPIATQISKLRFFLSLIIEQKTTEIDKILPLPNLETKIVAANSLIKLEKTANVIFNEEKKYIENKLKQIRKKHFDTSSPEEKKQIKKDDAENRKELKKIYLSEFKELTKKKKTEITVAEEKILIAKKAIEKLKNELENKELTKKHKTQEQRLLKQNYKAVNERNYEIFNLQAFIKKQDFYSNNYTKLANYDIYNPHVEAEFFDMYWMFFLKKGFDIVIGNPPYIQISKFKTDVKNKLISQNYKTYEGSGDIYSLFYEKSINLLNENGLSCFITSNKWMRAKYGESLRNLFSKKNPVKLIDMGPDVFNSATVDTNILLIENSPTKNNLKALTFLKGNKLSALTNKNFIELKNLNQNSWIILNQQELNIKNKIERIGTPLKNWNISINYGIKTGLNKDKKTGKGIFIINGKTKNELIAKDPKNAEIIKPILRGKDIKRYKAEFADMWLINTHNGVKAKKTVTRNLKKPFEKINDDFGIEILQPKAFVIPPISITDYPTIKKYLSQFWENLNKRQDKGYTPYNLRNCAYLQDFEKEKIVYPETTQLANFFFDKNTKYFIDKTGFIILGENLLYLNTILASTLIFYSYKKFYPGVELGKSGYQYNKHALKKIPIPQISEESQKPFEELAEIIISKKELGESTEKEENEIDLMVYKLYNLSYEEIKIIDPKTKLTKQEYEN